MIELRVDKDAPIAGKTLREAGEAGIIAGDMLVITSERTRQSLLEGRRPSRAAT